jgi:hypothetical protein
MTIQFSGVRLEFNPDDMKLVEKLFEKELPQKVPVNIRTGMRAGGRLIAKRVKQYAPYNKYRQADVGKRYPNASHYRDTMTVNVMPKSKMRNKEGIFMIAGARSKKGKGAVVKSGKNWAPHAHLIEFGTKTRKNKKFAASPRVVLARGVGFRNTQGFGLSSQSARGRTPLLRDSRNLNTGAMPARGTVTGTFRRHKGEFSDKVVGISVKAMKRSISKVTTK